MKWKKIKKKYKIEKKYPFKAPIINKIILKSLKKGYTIECYVWNENKSNKVVGIITDIDFGSSCPYFAWNLRGYYKHAKPIRNA